MSRFTENTPPAVAKGKMAPKQGVTLAVFPGRSLPMRLTEDIAAAIVPEPSGPFSPIRVMPGPRCHTQGRVLN